MVEEIVDEPQKDIDLRKAVADKFSFLTASLSAANLDNQPRFYRKYPPESITVEQREAITFIVEQSNPEDLANLIHEYPPEANHKTPEGKTVKLKPVIEIISPSEDEEALAQTKLVSRDGANEQMLTSLQDQVAKYMRAPRVRDGFVDHANERTQWEAVVQASLNIIDVQSNSKDHRWVKAFKDKWSNNKYATNKLTAASGYLLAVQSSLSQGSPLKKELESIYTGVNKAIDTETTNHDKRVDTIVMEYKRLTELFSPKS